MNRSHTVWNKMRVLYDNFPFWINYPFISVGVLHWYKQYLNCFISCVMSNPFLSSGLMWFCHLIHLFAQICFWHKCTVAYMLWNGSKSSLCCSMYLLNIFVKITIYSDNLEYQRALRNGAQFSRSNLLMNWRFSISIWYICL